MPGPTLLGAYVRHEPARAREAILSALREHDGNVTHAAKELGIGRRTLCTWVSDLGLSSAVEQIRRDAGWPVPDASVAKRHGS